jgi:UDP-N-acetylmuramate dehydrogenase
MIDNRFIEGVRSLSASGVLEYTLGASLSKLSTFQIGGKCSVVVYPKNSYALKQIIDLAINTDTPYGVFGRCSNVLFSDKGWSGALIVTTKMKGISRKGSVITAECGVLLNDLSKFAMRSGLSGGEFMFGIPGTVGGAVYMNAGAYEHSVAEIISSCSVYSIKENKVINYTRDEMELGYRKSVFMHDPDKIILEATFDFPQSKPMDEIKAQMDDYMSRRRSKQPLEYPSAGSVFKRLEGYFTAKLIDEAGLKGRMAGGAMVSTKHAGFIINYKDAKAEDVLYLINVIKKTIAEKYGLNIECEIIYFGDKEE